MKDDLGEVRKEQETCQRKLLQKNKRQYILPPKKKKKKVMSQRPSDANSFKHNPFLNESLSISLCLSKL